MSKTIHTLELIQTGPWEGFNGKQICCCCDVEQYKGPHFVGFAQFYTDKTCLYLRISQNKVDSTKEFRRNSYHQLLFSHLSVENLCKIDWRISKQYANQIIEFIKK